MSNIGMRLTRDGSNLLAKGLLGKTIHFTRGAIGDGDFDYDSEKVFDLTAMKNWKMDLPIEEILKTGDGTVRITVHKTNAEVYDGFPAKEHAIFATDPDSGKEILYAYRNTGNEYSFIPSNTGPVSRDIKFAYVTVIRDAENVTATLDLSFAYTSTADFNSHLSDSNPHPNLIQKLDDVIDTSHLWATDFDSNLHKISIRNLKRLITGDSPPQAIVDFSNAQNELGLASNVLILDELDNFKVKVTSSAENGYLLGLETVDNLRCGAVYTISDGFNDELIIIKSVRKNVSGFHAVLQNPLANSYDWNSTFLFRSTVSGATVRSIVFKSNGFGGVIANIERTLTNLDNFSISGDGFLTVDGFFTIS